MANLNRAATKLTKARIFTEYYYVPLALGLLLLILAYAPPSFRFRRASPVWLLVLIAQLPANGRAQAEGEDIKTETPPLVDQPTKIVSLLQSRERRRSETGVKLFNEGKFAEATEVFKEIQAEHPESPELAYSTGTALLKEGKVKEGKILLDEVAKPGQVNGLVGPLAAYNIAGAQAEAKQYAEALAGYASLVQRLEERTHRTTGESYLLQETRKRIEQLLQRQKQEQQDQQNDKDKKQNEEKQEEKKEENKQEKGSDDKSKSEEKQSENKESQEQDQQNQKGDKGEEKQKQSQRLDPSRRKKFKENEVLNEQDAKRILEALKQQEQLLQKKMLQQKTISRQPPNPNGKDW